MKYIYKRHDSPSQNGLSVSRPLAAAGILTSAAGTTTEAGTTSGTGATTEAGTTSGAGMTTAGGATSGAGTTSEAGTTLRWQQRRPPAWP